MPLVMFATLLYPALGFIVLNSYLTYNCTHLEKKLSITKEFIIIFAVAMASFGYGMEPIGETDLTRYFDMVDACKNFSFWEILKNDGQYLYTRDLLFYFVHKTGNTHLLPFFVGVSIYGICGYIIYDQIKNSCHRFTFFEFLMIIVISFSIISPYSLIGNVRCVNSYVLISFGAYRELVQKKRGILNYIIYIISIGLHVTAVIVVILRFIYPLFRKFKFLVIFSVFFIPNLIDFFYQFSDYYPSVIRGAVRSAYYYLHWTEGGWATEVEKSISNKVGRFYGSFFLVSVIICIFSYKRLTKDSLLKRNMISYLYGIIIVALASLSIKTGGFWRFESIPVLFSAIYLVPIFESNNKTLKKMIVFIFISACVMGCINIVMLYRNLVPIETLGNMLSLTGLQVFGEVLRGLWLF